MSVKSFLREARDSGLFADEEFDTMKSKIARSKRTVRHITCTDMIIEDTLRLCDKHADAIARHPELQAYLFERLGNIMLVHDHNKKTHAPELAKLERAKVDNAASETEDPLSSVSSRSGGLDSLKVKPIVM